MAGAEGALQGSAEELTDKTPDSPLLAKIKEELEHIQTIRQAEGAAIQPANLKEQIVKAGELFKQKIYGDAHSLR